MRRIVGIWLLALAALSVWLPACLAQTPSPVSGMLGFAPTPTWARRSSTDDPLEDRNGDLLVGNPLLDGPNGGRLGWFGMVEADLLWPTFRSQLTAPVAIANRVDTVALPSANLDRTVAPRVEVGYRLGQGFGEFIATYRGIATSGAAPILDSAGNPALLQSRFSMNVIDLDYASRENSLLPKWDMRWRVGVRVAGLYFDSEAANQSIHEHVTNWFWGGGPHAGLELWRPLIERHVAFTCRLDGAGVFGNVQQGFEETVSGPTPATGFTRQTQFNPTTMLNVQAGLVWTPTDSLHFSAGYTYEHWWDSGYAGASRGDLWLQGVYFRAEWRY